jgi:hypothetical protein
VDRFLFAAPGPLFWWESAEIEESNRLLAEVTLTAQAGFAWQNPFGFARSPLGL